MYKELDNDNLKDLIKGTKVMVQYGATWCGNCKITKPKFKKLSRENSDIEFIYVDAEKFPESRGLANVNNLPTFASFENGELVHQTQGNKIEAITEPLKKISL
jgi:thiol-disulfide isomerase/thioredoxin